MTKSELPPPATSDEIDSEKGCEESPQVKTNKNATYFIDISNKFKKPPIVPGTNPRPYDSTCVADTPDFSETVESD